MGHRRAHSAGRRRHRGFDGAGDRESTSPGTDKGCRRARYGLPATRDLDSGVCRRRHGRPRARPDNPGELPASGARIVRRSAWHKPMGDPDQPTADARIAAPATMPGTARNVGCGISRVFRLGNLGERPSQGCGAQRRIKTRLAQRPGGRPPDHRDRCPTPPRIRARHLSSAPGYSRRAASRSRPATRRSRPETRTD